MPALTARDAALSASFAVRIEYPAFATLTGSTYPLSSAHVWNAPRHFRMASQIRFCSIGTVVDPTSVTVLSGSTM